MPTIRHTGTRVRWPITLVLLSFAAAGLSGCDTAPGTSGDHPRQVTVVGSGQVQGVPDTVTVEAGIEFIAPDVSGAMNQTNDRQRAVIDALENAGVQKKDIRTTQVSLQPLYGPPELPNPGPITAYRSANMIRVRVEQESASQVLAVIASSGGDATRVSSVSYSIDDDSTLVRDARARAFQDARDRAEQYAKLADLKLGKVISISEAADGASTAPGPAPRGTLATPIPMEPGEQTVSFSVTAVWELV